MTQKLRKKRFIAGATCPQCKAQDTLMLYIENNVEKLRCVACDYERSQVDEEVETKSGASDNVIGIFKPE
ncbi:YheV family putative metal-binding protein [Paraneptunicella aestuarii]|uniref:YheV family putative zinc ribbon protein n=1 Tax=Paraneptunicella aestuarii TaxID=2831148 RepID=UPI001E36294D|nr:YheV family putative zinc ribbon protein [Paraneptunicella aestuarii]UAA40651.1 YheV family putative metal-binding protein [Paraneptunicella aestuarii]